MTSAHPLVQHQARPLVGSVTAHVVSPDWATRVVSPLHDVLSEADRRAILADNPDSYLHVTSDPLALPEATNNSAAESAQAKALRRLLDLGAYTPVPEPALFVYRLTERGRAHTGVIASVAVEGFANGRVLGHEDVQPERVSGLVRHYDRVPKRSELVALFHPVDPAVAELTARVTAGPPILDFTDASGVVQSVWHAPDAEASALARRLGEQRLFIADGHHRVAAAIRSSEQSAGSAASEVLCALYPQNDVELHAFHRRVRGPVELRSLLERLAASFHVTPTGGSDARPSLAPGVLGLYAAGSWYLLRPRELRRLPGVAGLDVTMLDDLVLRPLLGIDHGDPRLQFGLTMAGMSAARARVHSPWLRFLPLTIGLYVFAVLTPGILVGFTPGQVVIGGWMLLFATLGRELHRVSLSPVRRSDPTLGIEP